MDEGDLDFDAYAMSGAKLRNISIDQGTDFIETYAYDDNRNNSIYNGNFHAGSHDDMNYLMSQPNMNPKSKESDNSFLRIPTQP